MSNLRAEHINNLLPMKHGKDSGKLASLHHAIAMTAIVPMRKGVGLDHLGYTGIVISTLVMLVASWVGNFSWLPFGLGNVGPKDYSLLCFALVYPALALYQRRKREAEIKSGALPEGFHTESVGWGRFDFLPFERRLLGFIDPFVVLLTSALLVFRLHLATLLGCWGLLAGAAFFIAEAQVYSHCEAIFRAGLNALTIAKVRGKVFSHVEEAQDTDREDQQKVSSTIATGMDGLLMLEIARRGKANSQVNTEGL